ncbi:MAG: hypothetical protein WC205_10495 [Opitutaceae bacterium]|jgi:hypothetical protein
MAQLSGKLDDLLLDDCHIRYALGLLKELNDDLTLRAKAIEQSLSSRTRFLPTIGRPDELAAVEAAKAELAKTASAWDTMRKLHALIIPALENELESHVRAVSPDYVRGLSALDNLVAWPGLLERLSVKLAGVQRSLGHARNMASSGYDRQRRDFSPAGIEAINMALSATRELDDVVSMVNGVSDRHQLDVMKTPHAGAVLPRVPVVGFAARIERVRTLGIAEVQAEFSQVLEMCSMLETVGLAGLRDATERVAALHRELGHTYLTTYLGQLRAYMDEHRLVPTQVTARIQRLQLRHLGAVNFPFELG